MKFEDIKIGMFVVCKERHDGYTKWPTWARLMNDTVGKKMTVIELDTLSKTVQCESLEGKIVWWYIPEWLSPWEEEQKGLIGYYQGIDVTGLDRDIIARMAENNNDLCSSKIFNTIAKLNRCKQVNPKTARLVDDLIRELVDILDLHEHEEKKDNIPLKNQIEILKEENEKLKKEQKKKDSVKINKTCTNCKYATTPNLFFPCDVCSTQSHWQPSDTDIIKKSCGNCRYVSYPKEILPCSRCNNYRYWENDKK